MLDMANVAQLVVVSGSILTQELRLLSTVWKMY